jgi:hypothetical protein
MATPVASCAITTSAAMRRKEATATTGYPATPSRPQPKPLGIFVAPLGCATRYRRRRSPVFCGLSLARTILAGNRLARRAGSAQSAAAETILPPQIDIGQSRQVSKSSSSSR